MKKKHLHTLVVLLLVVSLLVSSLGASSAETTFTPDSVDVCASVLAASGLTFKNTAAYRSAGQHFYEYLRTHDTSSMSTIDKIGVRLAENITAPFRATADMISSVRSWFHNQTTDDSSTLNVNALFYNSFNYYNSLTRAQVLQRYGIACVKASSLRRVSYSSINNSIYCEQANTRRFWDSFATLVGQIGAMRAYAFLYCDYNSSGKFIGRICFALFDGDTVVVRTENKNAYPFTYYTHDSSYLVSRFDNRCVFFYAVPYPGSEVCYCLCDYEVDENFTAFPAGLSSDSVLYRTAIGGPQDYVPWIDFPVWSLGYDSAYFAEGSSKSINIDTLIYMPTYNTVSTDELEKPITPDSVRSDPGGTDPEPKPEPKPDPGTEPDDPEKESVINKIYNFIVPILGEIKAGISDLIDAVAKIPAKIGDLLGGIGDDLAGLAAFLPTLLGILTGYTLFVSLFSHFLPEPVYLTVYAFFVATIVVHLIRWVANR